jgi:hypothetical protein
MYLNIAHQGWQRAFDRFDSDKSGTIDRKELQNALTDFGYLVTPQLLNIMLRKYGLFGLYRFFYPHLFVEDVNASAPHACTSSPKSGTPLGITFDRFVRACVVLHQVTEAFNNLHTNSEGWVKIDYLQFLQTVLSLP